MVYEVISAVASVRDYIVEKRALGKKIHYIATMGALHAGHLELIRQANTADAVVVVSIFVNPLQFDDDSDFSRYPRSIEVDAELAFQAGAEMVFAPSVAEMYPQGVRTYVQPSILGSDLEGTVREAHFSGMLTIVLKFLDIIHPHRTYFGEKDYQQLILVRQMVEDFFIPCEVWSVPTLREESGLAMSSRNCFLSAAEFDTAKELYHALCLGVAQAKHGAEAVVRAVLEHLAEFPEFTVDYCELRDDALSEAKLGQSARLLIAVHLGKVRLIDNIYVPKLG